MDGLDGIKINAILKKDIRTAHIPVIVFSGSENAAEMLGKGVIDYIKKPAEEDEIIQRINVALHLYPTIRNIFVIDDDSDMLKLYGKYLHKHSYNAFLYNNPKDALGDLSKGSRADLIILDLMMPVMSGFEFLSILKDEMKSDVPVIIATAKDLTAEDIGFLKEKSLSIYRKGENSDNLFVSFMDDFFKRRASEGRIIVESWLNNMENDEVLKAIVLEAIKILPESIINLENAILHNDIPEIKIFSHSIKGFALNVRMTDIYERAEGLNSEANKLIFDMEKIKRLFVEIKEIVSSIPSQYFLGIEDKKEQLRIADGDGFLILVVEDDKINQRLIQTYMQRMNLQSDIAENGKVALEMMHEKIYPIIFLDMQMPVMDGLETIHNIRASAVLKNTHVVALTANAMKGDEERYIAAGCNEYLPKPVYFDALKEKIDSFATKYFLHKNN